VLHLHLLFPLFFPSLLFFPPILSLSPALALSPSPLHLTPPLQIRCPCCSDVLPSPAGDPKQFFVSRIASLMALVSVINLENEGPTVLVHKENTYASRCSVAVRFAFGMRFCFSTHRKAEVRGFLGVLFMGKLGFELFC
jgi:hypothetical protein